MSGINEIRSTFSKGSIVLDNGNVSVIYTDQDWITQSIDGEHKNVFSNLLESSKKFTIRIKKENSIRLGFLSNDSGQNIVYYGPIEKEIGGAEIEEIIRNMQPSEEFIKFFDGVNLKDETDVLAKLIEWTDIVSAKWRRKVISIDRAKLWPEIKTKALLFANANGCQTEIIEPDDINDGSIDIQIPEVFSRPLIFTDQNKKMLIELIDMCDEVGLEMNPHDGYFNLILML